MGSNKWQSSETWPPEKVTLTSYYLTSNGKTPIEGWKIECVKSKFEHADGFIYDPMKPVPSMEEMSAVQEMQLKEALLTNKN